MFSNPQTPTSLMAESNTSRKFQKHSNMDDDYGVVEANKILRTLVAIFPRILPEVFREMLTSFDGESCLYIVVEQLLKHEDKWVRGRWKVPTRENIPMLDSNGDQLDTIPISECFRLDSYKRAVRLVLHQEFKALSKSTVDAVMAEHNYSYTRSRPTLQEILTKSWRRKIGKIFTTWKRSGENVPDPHAMVRWTSSGEGKAKHPEMKKTGHVELDQELKQTVMTPLIEGLKAKQISQDQALAIQINELEAKSAQALYECECCFLDTTFEQMATCTTGGHIICFRCLRHVVSEAIFGQSWSRNIDHQSGQIKCLAPLFVESCAGCIPRDVTYRAISQSEGGVEQIRRLESRLADGALLKSQLPLIRCPFCPYAEVNDLYVPPEKCHFRLNRSAPVTLLCLLFLALGLLPMAVIYTIVRVFSFCAVPSPYVLISNSLTRLSRLRYLPRRFQCQSPRCALPSCMSCFKIWHDPHICYESAILSLRTTVEAARTAAVKRTCPRCGLGFIKESGCNKLSCICGYMMCYICRQGLGNGAGGEGYRHFCQHFRPAGGKCGECDRCDLYRAEDEDRLVRRAGESAEREWRKHEGMWGVGCIGGEQNNAAKLRWWERVCTAQGLADWWIENILVC